MLEARLGHVTSANRSAVIARNLGLESAHREEGQRETGQGD
jgi:hypothetical protein